jgi:hypothetical protein
MRRTLRRGACLERKVGRFIATAVQSDTRPINELDIIERPTDVNVERAMQLPAYNVQRGRLRPARHQNQYRCQNVLPHKNLPLVSE